MKVIITGGYGFIGSNLIINFLNRYPNFKILNIDFQTYASNHRKLKFFTKYKNYNHKKINICNYISLKKAFLSFKPNIVINLAAETHVDNSINNADKFIKTNIIGTYNLLEISKFYYKSTKAKFIYLQVSTDEVYGDLYKSKFSFTEESNIKPSSPYSASKASSDHLVLSYFRTYNLPVIISRCTNNYGPYQSSEKLIPKVIYNALKKKIIPVYNKGKEIRDWIHVLDHTNALIELINKGVLGNVYNIGSNNTISNIQLIKKILKILSSKNNKVNYYKLIRFVKDRPGHDFKYSIDNTKIINKIKWKSKINFDYGLIKTIEWHINDVSNIN